MQMRELRERLEHYDKSHVSYSYTSGWLRTKSGRHKRVQIIFDFFESQKKMGKSDTDLLDLYTLVNILIDIEKKKKKKLSFIAELQSSIAKAYFFEWLITLFDKKIINQTIFDQLYLINRNTSVNEAFKEVFVNFLQAIQSPSIPSNLEIKFLKLLLDLIETNLEPDFLMSLSCTLGIMNRNKLLTTDIISKLTQDMNEFSFYSWIINVLNAKFTFDSPPSLNSSEISTVTMSHNLPVEAMVLEPLLDPSLKSWKTKPGHLVIKSREFRKKQFLSSCYHLINDINPQVKLCLLNIYKNQLLYTPEIEKLLTYCIEPNALQIEIFTLINRIFLYEPKLLTNKTTLNFFKINDELNFFGISDSLSILMENKLLCNDLINKITSKKNNYYLKIYLEILKQYPDFLILDNINIFIDLPSENAQLFMRCFNYFVENKLFDNQRISNLIDVNDLESIIYQIDNIYEHFSENVKYIQYIVKSTQKHTLTGLAHITDALTILKKSSFYSADIGLKLFDIKDEYLSRMTIVLKRLQHNNHLTEATFNLYLSKITTKKPSPDKTHLHIVKGNDGDNESWTQYTNAKIGFNFFVPDKSLNDNYKGGTGKILEGFDSLSQINPRYIIKKLDTDHSKKIATREVKYGRMFGRKNAHYFQQDSRWCVVYDWQPGSDLFVLFNENPGLIDDLSCKEKIESIVPIFQQLIQLHSEYRVHGDIKSENCIFNPLTKRIELIDFGSTHKLKDKHTPVFFTPEFIDKRLHSIAVNEDFQVVGNITDYYSFPDEMYSVGLVIHDIFPFFTVKYDDRKKTHTINYELDFSDLTPQEEAMYYLQMSLLNEVPSLRCTSEDALAFCESIIHEYDNFTQEKLQQLISDFLCKKELSAEDIILRC